MLSLSLIIKGIMVLVVGFYVQLIIIVISEFFKKGKKTWYNHIYNKRDTYHLEGVIINITNYLYERLF